MTTTSTQVTGLAELHKLLQTLPAKVEGNVMRGALRAGQRVIQAEVKGRAPVDDGALRNSIKISFNRKSQKYGWIRMRLTAGDKTAFYAHFIEYGTASYYTGQGVSVGKPYTVKAKKKGGVLAVPGGKAFTQITHPGIKPQAFMRPGFDAAQQPAIAAVAAYITRRLPKELLKNAAPPMMDPSDG